MQAMRELSSPRQVKQRVPQTSRSGRAVACFVELCGQSQRSFSQSVVGASRPRAAPRSQLFLGGVRAQGLGQRAWPLALASRPAELLPMRRRIPFEFCRRSCMLHHVASSSSKVALAVMRCVAGVSAPAVHIATVPQPNPSFKRTPDGAA
jgi:hypothetical protein